MSLPRWRMACHGRYMGYKQRTTRTGVGNHSKEVVISDCKPYLNLVDIEDRFISFATHKKEHNHASIKVSKNNTIVLQSFLYDMHKYSRQFTAKELHLI